MATTFQLLECPADAPYTVERHGFPGDGPVEKLNEGGTLTCVCGREGVVRAVEYPDDHPVVRAFSSPTVYRPRRLRRSREG